MLSSSSSIYQVDDILISTTKEPRPYVHVSAQGQVNTTGWSEISLSEVYYINPPSDGIWDINFVGSPPGGYVLQVFVHVSADVLLPLPEWCRGVRVIARTNNIEKLISEDIANFGQSEQVFTFLDDSLSILNKAIYRDSIAVYDDSFQPVGFCSGIGRIKMKKLRHELILVIEGPDEIRIRRCVAQAVGVGLIAAIAAVWITGGAALAAAISAATTHLKDCLGDSFDVKMERKSHWIEWCT